MSQPEALPNPRWNTRRAIWLAMGLVCFSVGAVGVVLPGVPTTGPMLLALACFSRGSQRLHDWLCNHRYFGPPLQRWRRERTIPLRAKIIAITSMTLSLGYVTLFADVPIWAVIGTVVLVAVGAFVVLRIPHVRPN